MRRHTTIWIGAAVLGAALVAGGTAVAFATTDGFRSTSPSSDASDDGGHLTGTELERASAAALEAAGGGTVVEAEHGDDGRSAYEVEVRLDSGASVEVTLNADYGVIAVGGDDGDSGSDD